MDDYMREGTRVPPKYFQKGGRWKLAAAFYCKPISTLTLRRSTETIALTRTRCLLHSRAISHNPCQLKSNAEVRSLRINWNYPVDMQQTYPLSLVVTVPEPYF
jgi:hypothetical protein